MPILVVTALPLPVRIDVPEGWTIAAPEDLPAEVAIAAAHPHPDRGVTASITVDGDRWPPHQSLDDVATSSVQRVADAVDDRVGVRSRVAVGTPEAPGVAQSLSLTTTVNGHPRDLIQDQVYLGLIDARDATHRAVIRIVLTVSVEQHDHVVDEYRRAVSSVVPVTG